MKDKLIICSDASVWHKSRKGGVGVVVYSPAERKIVKTLSHTIHDTTISVGELTGVFMALGYMYKNNATGLVFCDSQFSVNSVNEKWEWAPHRKHAQLIKKCIQLKKLTGAEVRWVKGHSKDKSGIYLLNHMADEIAGKARKSIEE